MDKENVKRVEPTPEVNVYLNKPFIADDKGKRDSNNEGFQQMLDDSIAKIKRNNQPFADVVNQIYDEALEAKVPLTPRQIQIIELQKARNKLRAISMVEEMANEMEQEIHLKH